MCVLCLIHNHKTNTGLCVSFPMSGLNYFSEIFYPKAKEDSGLDQLTHLPTAGFE